MNRSIHRQRFCVLGAGARRNLRQRHTAIKRSRPRKDVHSRRAGLLSSARAGYFFFVSGGPQEMHRPSTAFPQPSFAAFVVLLLHHATSPACGLAGSAAGRGRSLSGPCGRPSFARRGDGRRRGRWRDDFPGVSHRRHLARQLRRARPRRRPHRLLDADHRGFRKSAAPSRQPGRRPRSIGLARSGTPMRHGPRSTTRATRKRTTRLLTGQVAAALAAVAGTTDPAQRLAIVEKARRTLAEWPRTHFNYREAEIQPMLGMLDEIVAELRALTGGSPVRSRVRGAVGDAGAPRAAPAAADAERYGRAGAGGRAAFGIVGGAAVAAVGRARRARTRCRSAAERLARPRRASPCGTTVGAEIETDRQYQLLTARILAAAKARANAADVRGVER